MSGFDCFSAPIICRRFLPSENQTSLLSKTLYLCLRQSVEKIFDPPRPLGWGTGISEKIFQGRDYLTMWFCRVSNADSKTVVGFKTHFFYGGVTMTFRSTYLMVVLESVDQKHVSNRSRQPLKASFPLRILRSIRW